MKQMYNLSGLLFIISCLVLVSGLQAQTSRIAIVSAADTTFLHRHAGITVFTNFTDTLPFNFSIVNHLETKLQTYLVPGYTVTVVQLPDSVLKAKNGYFSSARSKKIKQWIKNSKDLYDFVIVIDNMELPEVYKYIPKNSSGLLSRPSFLAYYSTITFFAYRTSNLKALEYYNQGGELLQPIHNFKLPEDKKTFTPETMNLINSGFKTYLDSRVEYFLTKSYMVPQDKIDAIKAESGTAN